MDWFFRVNFSYRTFSSWSLYQIFFWRTNCLNAFACYLNWSWFKNRFEQWKLSMLIVPWLELHIPQATMLSPERFVSAFSACQLFQFLQMIPLGQESQSCKLIKIKAIYTLMLTFCFLVAYKSSSASSVFSTGTSIDIGVESFKIMIIQITNTSTEPDLMKNSFLHGSPCL